MCNRNLFFTNKGEKRCIASPEITLVNNLSENKVLNWRCHHFMSTGEVLNWLRLNNESGEESSHSKFRGIGIITNILSDIDL